MDNIDKIIVLAQWGLIIFFILLNFLIGFKRGTKKSFYYTVVSIFSTALIMLLVSFFSIRLFFTPGSFVNFIDGITKLPDNIREYLVNPNISPLVFAIIDMLLKIVLFFILYPILKPVLAKLFFKPIWNKYLKKTKEQRIRYSENGVIVATKKQRINVFSRFFGGMIGGFRGLTVAFVILLPVIVIAGATSKISKEENGSNVSIKDTLLATSNSNDDNALLDILEILENINNEGLGQVVKKIKIGEKSLDEEVFDFAFSATVVKDSNKKEKLEFSKELNNIGTIIDLAVKSGFLESDFDYKKISIEDYENIDQILKALGNSDLINIAIPIAIDYAYDEKLIEKQLGFDVKTNIYTKDALDALYNINFKSEFANISETLEEILKLGNVNELLEMISNPEEFLKLEQSKKLQLANVIEKLSKQEMLVALNIGLEYLINQESVLKNFDFTTDPKEYLHEKLAFIFENVNFLKGENGEIQKISDLIKEIFKEEYSDIDYSKFIKNEDGKFDIKFLLEDKQTGIVNDAIANIGKLETLTGLIPVGIDYFLYKNDTLDKDLSKSISEALNKIEYDKAFTDIASIYEDIVKIGVNAFFDPDNDMLKAVDLVLSNPNNYDTIKNIVTTVFNKSLAVEEIIKEIAKPVVTNYVKEENLKDFLVVLSETEEFSYGKEVINIIELIEVISKNSTFTDINSFIKNKEYVEMVKILGNFKEADKVSFKASITGLQVINHLPKELVSLLKNYVTSDIISIPVNYTSTDLKADLTRVLDLGFEVSSKLTTKEIKTDNYKDADLLEFIDLEKLTEILNFKTSDTNTIIFNSIVNFLKNKEIKLGNFAKLELPEELKNKENKDEVWINELNTIILGLLNVSNINKYDNSTKISINNLKDFKNLNTNIITRFTDIELLELTLGKLFDSKILKTNAATFIESYTENSNLPVVIKMPNDAYDMDYLSSDVLIDTINTMIILLEKTVTNENEVIDVTLKNIKFSKVIEVFNNLSIDEIRKIGQNKIINGIFRDQLQDPKTQEYLYKILDGITLNNKVTPINSGIFDYHYALSDGRIKEDTLTRILELASKLKLPMNKDAYGKGNLYKTIKAHIKDEYVLELFRIELVSDIFANLLNHKAVYEVLEGYFNSFITKLSTPNTEVTYNFDNVYDIIIGSLVSENDILEEELAKIVDFVYGLDTDKFKGVKINNPKDLENILSIEQFSKAVEIKTIHGILNEIINNEAMSVLLVSNINGILENTSMNMEFSDNMFLIPTTSLDENSKILKSELVSLLKSFYLIETETFKEINISTLTSMVNKNEDLESKDDFDRFLDSNIIHTYMDRIFKSEELSKIYGKIVSDIFNKDIEKVNTSLTDDLLDTNGLFKKEELKKLVVSTTMLGVDNFEATDKFTLATILDLLDDNKIHEFMDSKYVTLMISRLITSNTFKTLIKNGANINSELTLNATTKDSNGNLTKEEIISLLEALKELGLNDFNNISIGNDLLKSLTEERLSKVLESNYIYEVIDLILKTQIDNISEDAIVSSSKYHGYIKKEEIHSLIKALNILLIDDPSTINSEDITIQMFKEVLELESYIINRLISEQIMNVVTVPDAAMKNEFDILNIELIKLADALSIYGTTKTLNDLSTIKTTELTFAMISEINSLDSLIIRKLISDQIDSETSGFVVLEHSKENGEVKKEEIDNLVMTLEVLELNTIDEIPTFINSINNFTDLINVMNKASDANITSNILEDTITARINEL